MYKVIGTDQKEYGPVTVEQVKQWITEGRLNAHSKIKPENGDWQTVAALPEFASSLSGRTGSPPPAVPPAAGEPSRTSGMAIASLVLAVLGFCGVTAVVGLILGIVSLRAIERSKGRLSGRGLAIAGICVSAFMMLVSIPMGAAMLLPALARAKGRAEQINCMNHMKQLDLAVRIYSSDNNAQFPPAAKWCEAIQTSIGSPTVFQCPSHPDLRCGYAYNRNLDEKKEGEINPQTVLFVESQNGWDAAGGPEVLSAHKHSSRGGINVAFADGSVRTVPRSQLSSLRWEP